MRVALSRPHFTHPPFVPCARCAHLPRSCPETGPAGPYTPSKLQYLGKNVVHGRPTPARGGRQGAAAVRASRGITVPPSPQYKYCFPWLGTSNVDNSALKTQNSNLVLGQLRVGQVNHVKAGASPLVHRARAIPTRFETASNSSCTRGCGLDTHIKWTAMLASPLWQPPPNIAASRVHFTLGISLISFMLVTGCVCRLTQ